MGIQLPPRQGAQQPHTFWPMTMEAKRSPILATAELLFHMLVQLQERRESTAAANLMIVRIVLQYGVDVVERFFDNAHLGVGARASHQHIRVILAYLQRLTCK